MTHLWSPTWRSASYCGRALYTHGLTFDPTKADCAACLAIRDARRRASLRLAPPPPSPAPSEKERALIARAHRRNSPEGLAALRDLLVEYARRMGRG